MSPRYLVSTDPLVDEHRRLLLGAHPSRRRVQAWPITAAQWVAWVGWAGWSATRRIVRARGEATASVSGISVRRQRAAVLWAALAHGVHPLDTYRLELFDRRALRSAWRHVFGVESAAYHHARSRSAEADQARALLADKVAFGAFADRLDLTMPATVAVLPAGSPGGTLSELPEGGYIAKPRSGSAGRGIFRFEVGSTLRVTGLGGRAISGEVQAWVGERLAQVPYLIQPYVRSHSALASIGASAEEAVVVRLITELGPGGPFPWCCFAQVPIRPASGPDYALLMIEHGCLGDLTDRLTPSGYQRVNEMLDPDAWAARLATEAQALDRPVPGWDDLVATAIAAHRELAALKAIAWDFVISPNGPVLLEGNANWTVGVPQLICGPLLDR